MPAAQWLGDALTAISFQANPMQQSRVFTEEACSGESFSRGPSREHPTCAGRHLTALLSLCLLSVVGLLLASTPAASEQPTVCQCLAVKPELNWDNVEGAPRWVDGCKPRFDKTWKMHVVTLEPGCSTTVMVPANAYARVFRPMATLDPTDLAFWVSNGSGVARQQQPAISERGHSLVVFSDAREASLLNIVREPSQPCALTVAIFLSRFERPTEPAGFGESLCDGKPVSLRRLRDGRLESYRKLTPDSWLPIRSQGGQQLLIDTRYCYQDADSQRLQTYQLLLRYDGVVSHVIDFETTSDTHTALRDAVCDVSVGQRQRAVLCVPSGVGRVEVSSTAPLLLRVRQCGGYRHPRNGHHACGGNCLGFDVAGGIASIWGEAGPDTTFNPEACVSTRWLHRLSRDNHYRDGGLAAAFLANAQAARFAQAPEWQTIGNQMRTRHTGYRNLLPSNRSGVAQQFHWFVSRTLMDPRDPPRDYVLGQALTMDALRKSLSPGIFTKTEPQQPLTFALPRVTAPSWLRLVVDRRQMAHSASIIVQFDARPPMRLRVLPRHELAPREYSPSLGEVALASLHATHPQTDAGTLGGPFSQVGSPGELVLAGSHELAVPAHAKVVRVWCEGDARVPLAVQYRASNSFALSESSYLELSQLLGAGSLEFWRRITSESLEGPLPFVSAEVTNHWQPLLRLLRSHQRQLLSRVPGLHTVEELPTPATPTEVAPEPKSDVRSNPPVSTIAYLEDAREPELDRIEALVRDAKQLDMLEPLLLGRALHGDDVEARIRCYHQLLAVYQREDNLAAKERLTATVALQDPSYGAVIDLAESLRDQGRVQEALLVALAVGFVESPRATELVAECAYRQAWWRTFQTAVASLENPEQQSYWRGHELLRQGRYREAIEAFEAAGERGYPFARQTREGLTILKGLRSRQGDLRARAIFAWEHWQREHPGSMQWTEDPSLVVSSDGGALVRAINRDLTSRYYRTSPDVPTRLVVQGPAKLELTLRPVHTERSGQPRDTWLDVHGPGYHYVVPVNANRPSSNLEIIGSDELPGEAVRQVFDLGAGRHELLVAVRETAGLVQFRVARPATPIPVLPPLNRITIKAAAEGRLRVQVDGSTESTGQRVRVPLTNHGVIETPFFRSLQKSDGHFPRGLSPDVRARMVLRLGIPHNMQSDEESLIAEQWKDLAGTSAELDPHERLHALYHAGQLDEAGSLLRYGRFALPFPLAVAHIMDRQGARAVTEFIHEDPNWSTNPTAIYQHGIHLLRAAEDDPADRPMFSLAAFALTEQFPGDRAVQRLRERAKSAVQWSLVRNVESSGGIFLKEVADWSPESPRLKLRKELMRNLRAGDMVLGADEVVTLDYRNPEHVELKVEVELLEGYFRLPSPCVVTRFFDGEEVGSVRLDSWSRGSTQTLSIPPGVHQLRWRMDQSYLGQFVRLRVEESRAGISRPITKTAKRHYHIATHEEPIRLTVAGPSLLRIDALEGPSRYLLINEASRQVVLTPEDGVEGRYRIFQAAYEPGLTRRYPFDATPPPIPVPPPPWGPLELPTEIGPVADSRVPFDSDLSLLAVAAADQPSSVVDHLDWRELGGQEDGTWGTGLGWYHRRPADEVPFVGRADRFAELAVNHWQFDEDTSTYHKANFVSRHRDLGAHSFGLRHDQWYVGREDGWRLHHALAAYVQRPETEFPDVERDTEWSLFARGSVLKRFDIHDRVHHLPSFGVFGRVLSMDRNPYGPGQVDQDVFTRYKHDHPLGLTFSDRFVYERCADCLWWVRPAMTTNEGVDPTDLDNVRLSTGWSGIRGSLDFEVAHRYTRYLDDADRPRGVDQHMLFADVRWNHWSFAGRRLEVAGRLRHDLGRERASAAVWFTCFFDRGRGYRDFHGSELPFANVRRQAADWGRRSVLLE